MVSEAKKFATDSAREVVNHATRVIGGVDYTNINPIERMLRDIRLMMIWTGANEILNLIIQHAYYLEVLNQTAPTWDLEEDTPESGAEDEKIYA